MDARRRQVVDALWREGRAFDAAQEDRLDRRRNLEPESASFLNVLVRTLAPAQVLELGTSNGHSTLWLADALGSSGGRLTTVENDPDRAAQAATHLTSVGLDDVVEQLVDDIGRVLDASHDERWPVIFLDAERPAYPSYWPQLHRILTPGGLLVVDNCISHADEVAEFVRLVGDAPDISTTLLPVGAGLFLVSKDR